MSMATQEAIMAVIKASRPSFRNPHDKIAFALHATFFASGYSLVATGYPAFSYDHNVFSSPPKEEVGIDGWNETEDGYCFVYTINMEEKGLKQNTVVIKCLVMGDYLLIDALSTKTQDQCVPSSLKINVSSYNGENECANNFADRYKDFTKLVKTFKLEILDKVEDNKPSVGSTSASSRPQQEWYQPRPRPTPGIPGFGRIGPRPTPHPDLQPFGNPDDF